MLFKQKSPHKICSIQVLFWIAVFVRVWLGILNKYSNDPHMEVVELLRTAILQGSYPTDLRTCPECYHPKFYYLVCAVFLDIFGIMSDSVQIIISQLINVLASSIALYVVKDFFEKLRLPTEWKVLGFGLFAFNPTLIAINVQVTNDTFAISFGVLATYFFFKFLERQYYHSLIFTAIFLILGLLSKGNSLVILAWMLTCLALRAISNFFSNKEGGFWVKSTLFLVFSTLLVIALIGWPISVYKDYAGRWLDTGRLGAVNFEKRPWPHFIEKTIYERPGIVSIVDSYLTFRLFDLVENPYVSNLDEAKPLHRTSLWSMLYGQSHSLYFLQHALRRWDYETLWLGSILMVLGLPFTGLLVLGLFTQLLVFLRRLYARDWSYFTKNTQWAYPIQAWGFIAMIILFTLDFRGYASMKLIYILPGLLSFASAFVFIPSLVDSGQLQKWYIKYPAYIALSLLFFGYICNIGLLFDQYFRHVPFD